MQGDRRVSVGPWPQLTSRSAVFRLASCELVHALV
jgi:hypothetical protein